MSSFTEPLVLEALDTLRGGRGEFRVYKAFTYEIGYKGSGDTITVPEGFVTDLVSVPWFARPFVPLSGKLAKPALIHDWLFENNDSRASSIFKEALEVNKVSFTIRESLVAAVKLWWFIKKVCYVKMVTTSNKLISKFTRTSG